MAEHPSSALTSVSPEPRPAVDMGRSYSSGSTIPDPTLDPDTMDVLPPSSPHPQADPRNSLMHVLANEPPTTTFRDNPRGPLSSMNATPPASKPATTWVHDSHRDTTEDEADGGSTAATNYVKTPDMEVQHFAPGGSGRRNAHSGTTSSMYAGNKMKNIKKEDGIPLWRTDIQYEFLRAVFDDQTAVFTNITDQQTGLTFADIYIDAMARSTKTSKILRDKLLSDRAPALNMAMVCLLVNVGRMNTTLNCTPPPPAIPHTFEPTH